MDRRVEFGNPIEIPPTPARKGFGIKGSLRFLVPVAMAFALTVTASSVKADGDTFTADQSRVVRTYLQCGGEGYLPDHTVFVQQVRNPDRFNTADLGKIGGQCGNRWFSPDSEIQSLSQTQYQDAHGRPVSVGIGVDTFFYTRSYPQCGGSIGAMDFKPDYTILINEFVRLDDAKTFSYRNVGPQPGQCGNP